MKKCTLWVLALALLLCGCAARPDAFPVEEGRIRDLTEALCSLGPREVGTAAERAACGLLEGELEALGFSYEGGTLLRQGFTCLDGRSSENLIARCNGGGEGPIVTVAAHYDSVPASPGAGDNAVAAAILMELARLLTPEAPDFPGEVRLVFLGAEETGYHGSRCYLEDMPEAELARHAACFNMDISAATLGSDAKLVCNTLGGWAGADYQEGTFLEPMENRVSRAVARAWAELYGDGWGGTFHVGESDQVSFHNRQIDAGNVCWRGTGDLLPTLPDTYHQPTDTPDTLDYGSAVRTGRCVLRGVQMVLEQNS